MAKDIHPKMGKVKYQFSQNRALEITSTYKKPTFLSETDIFIHQAWRTDQKVVHTGSANVAKFNQAFGGASFLNLSTGGVDLSSKAPEAEAKEEVKQKAAKPVAEKAAPKEKKKPKTDEAA